MDSFPYEQFKKWLLKIFFISSDAFHIYLGILCLLAVFVLSRRNNVYWWMLIPGFLLALGMEMIDLWNAHQAWGRWRILASLHDLFTTNLSPVLMVLFLRIQRPEKTVVSRGTFFLGKMFRRRSEDGQARELADGGGNDQTPRIFSKKGGQKILP